MVRIRVVRPVLVVLLAAASLAVLAPAAPAKIKRGSFAGTTSADDPVSFRVDRRGRIISFSYDAVALSCTDGDSVDTPRVVTPRGVRFRVSRRRFGIRARNDTTGFGWDVEGRFRGRARRATGTLTVFASFNDDNQQDADGTIKCESEALTWSARRR
jgi:ABC-type amino acid transport substrate-binding protein